MSTSDSLVRRPHMNVDLIYLNGTDKPANIDLLGGVALKHAYTSFLDSHTNVFRELDFNNPQKTDFYRFGSVGVFFFLALENEVNGERLKNAFLTFENYYSKIGIICMYRAQEQAEQFKKVGRFNEKHIFSKIVARPFQEEVAGVAANLLGVVDMLCNSSVF